MELALDFISAIFIQIALFYFFGKLYEKKPIIKITYVISVIIVGMWQILMNLCGLNILSTISTVIYIFIMYIKMYGCSIKESRNYSIVIWIIAMLVDIVVALVFNTTNLVKLYFEKEKLAKAIATIIMSLIMILISNIRFLIKNIKRLMNKINKLNIPLNQIFIVIAIFIVISFVGIQSMGDMENVMSMVLLEIYTTVIIVFLIIMKYQIRTLKITNQILEKNNEINMKIITEYKVLKHNLENQLLGIKTVANKPAKMLLEELIKTYNNSFVTRYNVNSMPSGINGLIMEKIYEYNNLKITIDNRIKNNILDEIGPRRYNLFCEALGISLDNALQASSESVDKIISLSCQENNEIIKMTITNSFSGMIDIEMLGKVNYTSKEFGHGLGLYSLIGRKNLHVSSIIKNNLFVNMIIIKKKKNPKKDS